MPENHPDPAHQPELLPEEPAQPLTPEQEAERQEYRQRLKLHLQDPELRAVPGFPHGDDEAILALSDPPYYTACPNPFLGEIIEQWQQERQTWRAEQGYPDEVRLENGYHREPFATDVSEGKNDPIYNAHSYHTKVPHKAIMRYILHYTDPGDLVLDGFCGTGMTGVASQLCGDRKTVESLGYQVSRGGKVTDGDDEEISRLGARKAVLVDLSPAATFIAYNYNTPVDAKAFEREARRILKDVEKECGWMYETRHSDGSKGKINFTVWSDVFVCPQCGGEMVFWDVAVDHKAGKVRSEWDCPHCRTRLSKSPRKNSSAQRVERAIETRFDRALGENLHRAKQAPVLINYSVGKQRHEKSPDTDDLALIRKIEDCDIPYSYPTEPMMFKGENWGDTWRAGVHTGLTHVHHFYTHRNLWVMAATIEKIYASRPLFVVTALIRTLTKMFRWAPHGKHTAGTSGTLYVPSVTHEYPIFDAIRRRLRWYKGLLAFLDAIPSGKTAITTGSSSKIQVQNDAIDYIFVDPPFGANLMYSELNFLWEAWLGIFTNAKTEAIVNTMQRKGLPEYQVLMESCFQEFYRVLKPGRWMTIEFHNSQNAVWNAIQEGLLRAGFMVADVRTLDKQQNTFKQVTSTSAVKQDLIISAYKPAHRFEQRFLQSGGSPEAAWDFTRQHLEQLPPPQVREDGLMETLAERQPYLLYDRMVQFHVQRGLPVPLSAPEFYQGLGQRFLERDGMIFTPEKAAEYDKRRLQAERVEQLALFVSDEKSALQWLRRELNPETGPGPQTYGELQPRFMQEARSIARHEQMPELRDMLEDNFLQDAAGNWYLPDPGKQADLEALRLKSLLREFNTYLQGRGRLRAFRGEAVRAGFSHHWKERGYQAILHVAERLPDKILAEDLELLMYVDNARLRAGDQPSQPGFWDG